jgi:anaerobic selenocysteine-containing dehydrogenase
MTLVERASVCTLDCPDTCSLTVTVDGSRLVKVRGSDALPYTDGVICTKVAHHSDAFVHGPGRFTHPLRRTGARGSGEFARITWDEALDLIHARVAEVIGRYGPQAVMPLNYAGPHGMLAYDSMSLRFFHKLGATQLFRGALCGAVRSEAWAGTYGNAPGIGPEAAGEAALNVIWGNNATVTNLHLVRQARAAKRKGGRLAVIDPLRTKIAAQADLHLAPLPGTDVVLGFALALELERIGAHDREFIAKNVSGYEEYMAAARAWPVATAAEVCRVAADDIRKFARWMAEADPLVIAPGNGLERGANGGGAVRVAIALPALMGKLNARSGVVLGTRNAFPKTPAKLTRTDLIPPGTRTLNIVDVGRHLERDDLDPPLRAVFIYNHNPIVVHPDQARMQRALKREDIFFVGIEVAMTESMRHCDVVLPAATHFECDDLHGAYGHHWLQRAEAVIPPVGKALPNTEIFRRLAARFDFDDPCFKASDRELMDDAIDNADPRMQGVKASEISPRAALRMVGPGGRPLALYDNAFPTTPSGKVELASETLAKRWGVAARLPTYRPRDHQKFPLALISPASDKRISSTLFGAGGVPGEAPPLFMNPRDAQKRGLKGVKRVRVFNERGAVILPLKITDAVVPGVVASEKGAWLATSPNGSTISALVSADARADLAQGACFNDTAVEVEAA